MHRTIHLQIFSFKNSVTLIYLSFFRRHHDVCLISFHTLASINNKYYNIVQILLILKIAII